MVEEAYVNFKIAKLLKDKGFRVPVITSIEKVRRDIDKYKLVFHQHVKDWNCLNKSYKYSCPTQQLVCKWLREVHYLHVVAFCPLVDMTAKKYGVTYNLVISDLNNNCLAIDTGLENIEYNTYELAIQEGIEYCLEHLI